MSISQNKSSSNAVEAALVEGFRYSKWVESKDSLSLFQKNSLKNQRVRMGEDLNNFTKFYLGIVLEAIDDLNKNSSEKSKYCIQDWDRAMECKDSIQLREIKSGILREYSKQFGKRCSSPKEAKDEEDIQNIQNRVFVAKQNLQLRSIDNADKITKFAKFILAESRISPKSVLAVNSLNPIGTVEEEFSLAGDWNENIE